MNELIDTFLEITYFRTMVAKEVHLLNRTVQGGPVNIRI